MGNGKNQTTGMRITHYLLLITLLGLLALPVGSAQAQFDHQHKAWTALLNKHVVLTDGGKVSQVRYAGMQKDHAQLKVYLASLSNVSEQEFKGWSKPQQLAFLINAYNAHMIEKVLTRYPDIKSVWDFGKIFDTYPWYSVDFTSGLRGIQSREQFFAGYADLLTDDAGHRKIIREQKAEIRHLDYDWNLNDAKR